MAIDIRSQWRMQSKAALVQNYSPTSDVFIKFQKPPKMSNSHLHLVLKSFKHHAFLHRDHIYMYTHRHAVCVHTWMCGLITMHTKQQIVAKSKFATQAKLDYSRSIQGDYNILSYLYFMFTHLLPLLIATLAQFAETTQNKWRV